MTSATYDGLVPPRLIYIKQIDADNDGIFATIKRNGVETEVRIYPVDA
jgi:hypothetical protein